MRDEITAARDVRAYKGTASQRLTLRLGGAILIMVAFAPLLAHGHALTWWTPFLVLLGVLFVYAPARCGVYVTEAGIESKMFRRVNTFRCPWGEVVSFEVVDNGFQCAVTVGVRDGTRKILPLDPSMDVRQAERATHPSGA